VSFLSYRGPSPFLFARARALAPALGADNAAVYDAFGLDAADLERLARDGVI
jgi:hypothetical protein